MGKYAPVFIILGALVIGAVIVKQQHRKSPSVAGCPTGTQQVVLEDGTLSCAMVVIDEPSK